MPSRHPKPRAPGAGARYPTLRSARLRISTWPRIHLALAAFGILLIGALWARTVVRIDFERHDAIEGATRKSSALALAFEERTLRVLDEIDNQLLDAGHRYLHHGPPLEPRAAIGRATTAQGLIRDLAVVDQEGRRVLALGDSIPANVADREYFAIHRQRGTRGMFVGRSAEDSLRGNWSLAVSRRIERQDGSFAGVAVAAIDAAKLSDFHRDAGLGSDDVVGVIGLDGTTRVRETGREVSFDQDLRDSTLFFELARRSRGDFLGRGKLDGVRRFYGFRTLPRYSLIVMVGTSEAGALATFRARERNYLLVAGLGTALIGAFVAGIASALRRLGRSMEELSEAESRYREIFENTRDCIFVLEVVPEGRFRILALNPAGEAATGISGADAVGRFLKDVLPEPVARSLAANYRRCVDECVPIAYEEVVDLPAGRTCFDTTLLPIRVDGDRVGRIVGVSHNITERKRAEEAIRSLRDSLEARVVERTAALAVANEELAHAKEHAEQASRAKSTFLAMMSHEIRTPINGLLGALELLSQVRLEPDHGELLEAARSSGKTLLALLNDLLDMAKIEAGRFELVDAPHSLQSIVQRTMSTHRVSAARKGLQIRSSIDLRAPEVVLVDDLRVTQILGNLVSNAIKFTPAGSVDVHVAVVARQADECRLTFRVTDTGIGIEPATLQRLFRPFEQGAAARAAGGTGLGLAISRGLAELMGGTLSFESTPGLGTVASFELEVTAVPREALPDQGSEPEIHTPVARGTSVLVVDDHPINRMVLARQLELLGCIAEQCEDGEQALRRFVSGHYDVVITDCEMPVMDGYALALAIRAREREGRRTPVIACTAHAMAETAARCREAGMDGVLHKPIVLAELARALAAHGPAPQEASGGEGGRAGVASPLDDGQLALITGGDPALGRELLLHFRRACSGDAAALRRAVDARDRVEAARLCHRLKGASRTIGASLLATASEEVERAARAGDWNRAAVCLRAFEDELRGVMDHVDTR